MSVVTKKISVACAILISFFAVFSQQAFSTGGSFPPDSKLMDQLIDKHLKSSYHLLKEVLSVPNDAHFPDNITQNVALMKRLFQERNFATIILRTKGAPLLFAERIVADANQTILVYLQIDGQPVDPSRWQQANPYKPVLKEYRAGDWKEISWRRLQYGFNPEWRVFARSASDAKGPVVGFLTALDILDHEKLVQTHNVKVIMDFEEEISSPNLPTAAEQYKDILAADMMLVYDGPRHPSNKPTLYFGARGIVRLSLTVFGPRKPQHSGTYGNYVPNPALRLSRLLAGMKDDVGRVTIPGYYKSVNMDSKTKALVNRVSDDEQAMLRSLGIKSPDNVAETYQESIQFPSLSILGLKSAEVGKQTRTVVPDSATAELDIRLTPGSNAGRLIRLVRQYINDQGYFLISGTVPTEHERLRHEKLVSFTSKVGYPAFRTSLESEQAKWIVAALTRAFSEPPIKVRLGGGSIPIAPFVNNLQVPAIVVPSVSIDNNQHSPNENLRLGNYVEGIKTYLSILTHPF